MTPREIIEALKKSLPDEGIRVQSVTPVAGEFQVELVDNEDPTTPWYIGNFADPGLCIGEAPPYQGVPMVRVNGIYMQALWKVVQAFIMGYPD